MNTPQKTPMPRKKLIAIVSAAAILAGTVTLTSVNVARANAEETERLCAVATLAGDTAATQVNESTTWSGNTLDSVKNTTLPAAAGTSTSYADRPAVTAVTAAPGVEAVLARPSGADLIAEVSAGRAALVKIKIPAECDGRDAAEIINVQAAKAKTATDALNTNVKAVAADFALFQTEETARIAAEIEASRAAAEAARVAAETEAARVAAEAAREAADARETASDDDSSSSDSSFSSDEGSYSAPAPAPNGGGSSSGSAPSGPPGGGGMGFGDNGQCVTSNGMGGTMPC